MVSRGSIKLDLKVPFDAKGNQLGHPYYSHTLKDNAIFEATMIYTSYSKGRSSVKFHFESENGLEYEMFMVDFDELVKDKDLSSPVKGNWSFRKAGANYGLVYVKD